MTNPKVAVCLRVQQKSVWCLSSQSVFIVLVHNFVPLCPTHAQFHSKLASAAFRSAPISLFEKGGEVRSSSAEESGRRRRESHQQCLRCGISEASCYPGLLRPRPPSRLDGIPAREEADEEMGICVEGEEEVGSASLLCSAVRVKAHLLCPSSSERRGRRQRATWRKKNFKKWAATTAIVWLDCFGQSWGTDWDCSCLGGHRWAGRPQPRFPDLLSSPASPG